MKVGILEIKSRGRNVTEGLVQRLNKTGAEVAAALTIADSDSLAGAINYLFVNAQCILMCGDPQAIKSALSSLINVPSENIADMFVINERDVIIVPSNCTTEYIDGVIMPMITAKVRTLYVCEIFRTYGLTEQQVKELLKPHLKNRGKISITVAGEQLDCEVAIRYSNKTGKITVDELIRAVSDKLRDYIYSVDGNGLCDCVVELLKQRNCRLAVAESFTGGNICARLVGYDGISNHFEEGVVAYSGEAKSNRLNIPPEDITKFSAVSGDIAYEMAAGLLQTTKAGIALATTGYAGSAPDGRGGLCYIAVGSIDGIHVYEHRFEGERSDIIECGVQAAFYHLIKLLSGEQRLF